ncbi:pleckstrin homology domain-containing family G member 5 isoform X3 [Arapaima gigas]
MFLYWKKRGAYELETLPSSLSELGAERYSWASSLDVIPDLCDEKPAQEEKHVACQHPDCPDRRRAAKVCHHPDCQDLNNKSPLSLCESCDSRCHMNEMDSMHFDRHPRFDLQPQGSILARNVSTRSCPPRTSPPSHLEEEEDGGSDRGDRKSGGMKPVKKKPRRRHTDDPSKECFTLKFDLNVDIDTEIVPAMKKKNLREVLGPVFERKGIELSRVELFLDQSNTPLSLNFEAFRFGGHYLKVKARPGDELKVEQGVKDLRSLSLPIMKPSGGGHSSYIVNPGSERVEHGSLGRRESIDLLGQARRRKNMPAFLGDASIPSPDSLAQLGGSLPSAAFAAAAANNNVMGPDSWKNRAASRFSGFFSSGSDDGNINGERLLQEVDRMEQLQNKLQSYTMFGLPKVPPQLSFHQDSWEEEGETNLDLEDSWKQLLDDPDLLSRRQFHQQEAIWELLQTEAAYIKKLRVITDLFLCCLLNLQDSGFLLDVEPTRLFSNVQDIVRLHTALWAQVMLPALESARRDRTLLDPTQLEEGFRTIGVRFQPYIRYCMEEEACMEYMRSLLRDNESFRTYVTWAETHKQCNRLKLADMLVKPHQRLTKYPLLLKTVLKKTDDPSTRDVISSMVVSVETFINSIDSQMRQRQEKKMLATVSSRIESYEAVDGGSEEVERILREFNRFDLMAPMKGTPPQETRQLHLEGVLRMKEGKDSRMDVYCFLFTDVLLITKPVKRVEKVKVIRQPLLIHNVVCRELKDPGSFLLIYLNEFRSAVAAYSFQANSTSQGRIWIDSICQVQNQFQKLRAETLRQQRGSAGEPEEEESSNSAASSPCLQHKEAQSESHSDGSTETLSVAVMDDTSGDNDSSSAEANPSRSLDEGSAAEVEMPTPTGLYEGVTSESLGVPVDTELDPQCRSLSMDSAYGTLSPESMLRGLDLRERPSRGEEETEGEEVDTEGETADPEEEEEVASTGSQQSVANSLKLRRQPPVQPRLRCLQTSAHKSRSEDNLLQLGGATRSPPLKVRERRAPNRDRLAHSKSMSQLFERDVLSNPDYTWDLTASYDGSSKLMDSLRRANAQQSQRANGTASDGDAAPPCLLEEGSVSSTEAGLARCNVAPQHKKLTLAQLYRIRTTMVLNSTLTASEV